MLESIGNVKLSIVERNILLNYALVDVLKETIIVNQSVKKMKMKMGREIARINVKGNAEVVVNIADLVTTMDIKGEEDILVDTVDTITDLLNVIVTQMTLCVY